MPDKDGGSYLDVNRGFSHGNALMLKGPALQRNPEAYAYDQALLTSFEGAYVKLPRSDAFPCDNLLLVAVGHNPEPVTLEGDRHQWRGRDFLQPRFAVSAQVLEKLSVQ